MDDYTSEPRATVPYRPAIPQKICVVIPCYHEEHGIDEFYSQLKNVLVERCGAFDHEIILVDDGSRDATLERLQRISKADDCVSVYSLARNQGHQTALSAGLEHADSDAVIMMDADLQHPPTLIPQMIDQWQLGNDVVLGVRQQTEDASLFKRITSNGFYWVFNLLSDVKLTPGAADFCLLSRRVHQQLCEMPERRRFLRGMIAWLGFDTARIEYTAPARFAGQSGYGLTRMLKLAMDATVSFSTRPIRLATKGGALCVAVGLMYLSYITARYVLLGDLSPGWASILGTVIVLGGAQLLSIGLIGEYLAHIFEEVKGRPSYVMKYSATATSKKTNSLSQQDVRSYTLPLQRKAS